MVKCIVVVVVLVVCIITIIVYTSRVRNTTTCRLTNRYFGQCIDIGECKLLKEFLEQSKTEDLSHPLLADIEQFKCSSSSDQKVCCPIGYTLNSREKSPSEDTPDDLKEPPKKENSFDKLPSNCGMSDNINFDKVAYGEKADLFEFPWMALLGYKGGNEVEYRCAGSLIHKRYVLTAAHCLLKRYAKNLVYVRLGEHNLNTIEDCHKPTLGKRYCSPPTQDIPIESFVVHPKFDYENMTNDIALIKLSYDADITQDNVGPICLPSKSNVKHNSLQVVVVSGFGLTENSTRSFELLKSVVPVLDLQTCKSIYKDSTEINEKQMCILGPNGEASCQGDSGGAVISLENYNMESDLRFVQNGIVSFGPWKCGDNLKPSVSTNIEFFLDWILDNID